MLLSVAEIDRIACDLFVRKIDVEKRKQFFIPCDAKQIVVKAAVNGKERVREKSGVINLLGHREVSFGVFRADISEH